MKIVVVSDSHGNSSFLNDIYYREHDADLFIHCGDFCLPDYLMNNYRFVIGNCDWSMEAQNEINIPTKFGIIHVEHGNNFTRMSNLEYYLRKNNIFIFLSGHTHEKRVTKINNTYIFNPGSLTRPRDSDYGSYLIIDLNENNRNINYTFKKIDLNSGEYIGNFNL